MDFGNLLAKVFGGEIQALNIIHLFSLYMVFNTLFHFAGIIINFVEISLNFPILLDLLYFDQYKKNFTIGNALLRRLVRIGVLDESKMKLDYVLGLRLEDFLERRLQTQVFKLGLAKSIHHARVLIRQRHIRYVNLLPYIHCRSLTLQVCYTRILINSGVITVDVCFYLGQLIVNAC